MVHDLVPRAAIYHLAMLHDDELIRPLVFDDVVVRVDPSFTPRVHIDFDEANACAYQSGDFGMIIRG